MRDSFLRAVAPALSLEELLAKGPTLARQFRERRRKRPRQMTELRELITLGPR